jgi:hypothetical protein
MSTINTATRTTGLPQLLTTAEVARSLRVNPSTLCRWRAQGIGPKVVWLAKGVPRYVRDDVDAWLARSAR